MHSYRGVCDNRVCHIGEHPPDITHPTAELFDTAGARNEIAVACIQPTHQRSDAGA